MSEEYNIQVLNDMQFNAICSGYGNFEIKKCKKCRHYFVFKRTFLIRNAKYCPTCKKTKNETFMMCPQMDKLKNNERLNYEK